MFGKQFLKILKTEFKRKKNQKIIFYFLFLILKTTFDK